MPEDAPRVKLDATRGYGGDVVLYDRQKVTREELGAQIAAVCRAVAVRVDVRPSAAAHASRHLLWVVGAGVGAVPAEHAAPGAGVKVGGERLGEPVGRRLLGVHESDPKLLAVTQQDRDAFHGRLAGSPLGPHPDFKGQRLTRWDLLCRRLRDRASRERRRHGNGD